MAPSSRTPADNPDPPSQPITFSYQEIGPSGRSGATALAEETPLAISFNGINQAVMMVSPHDLDDFITGFSISNRIIDEPNEIRDIQYQQNSDALLAQVEISHRAHWHLKQHRRQLMGASGCGICGVEALEQAMPDLAPLEPAAIPHWQQFDELRDRIARAQTLAQTSGALHAALYLDEQGEIRFCREDIGRHNALDKLIGAMAWENSNANKGVVVITSRCGLELVHKAVRARIGTLATLSAPSAVTVRWARHYHLNLIHVPHESAPRLYSPAP